MVEEQSTMTTQDTETSTSEAPVDVPAVVEATKDAPVDETPTTTTEEGGTVLGGEDESAEAGDESAADKEAEAEGPPEEYALSLKDAEGNDIALDADSVAEASEVFRNLGLSNEQANALMPVANSFMQRTQDAMMQQMSEAGAAQKKDWLDEFIADPEIGGKNREQTEELAAKGLDALGFTKDHPFRELLNATGLGNNKDLIRVFRTLGEVHAEDGTFARPNAGGEPETVGWSDLYQKD